MSFSDVRILYLRELRAALRERSILIGSVLVPLLLYPLLLWMMFSVMTFLRGQEERFTSRVALVDLPAEHQDLEADILGPESVELVAAPAPEERAAAVAGGELDAVVEFLPAEVEDAGLAGNFRLRVVFDGSKDRSAKARERVEEALETYRDRWIRDQALALGVAERTWQGVVIERRDLASSGERGAFLLGMMVPLLMIIMIAVGCLYPAIDATAGERERSTWETSMSLAASRTSIVVAKYLYVATLGGVAGLLNLAAMTLSMGAILAPLLGDDGGGLEFNVPFAALPLMALAAVSLALFIAAGMMIFAAFARTFKEGQSMVSPFYMLCILPAMFIQSPDLELDLRMALIPIVNVALLFREAIAGVFHWPAIFLTFAVLAFTIAVCLAIARLVLGFEDVLMGSYGGSLGKLVKERLLRRRAAREDLS